MMESEIGNYSRYEKSEYSNGDARCNDDKPKRINSSYGNGKYEGSLAHLF